MQGGRAAGPPVTLDGIAPDDALEIELQDGVRLWTRADDFRADFVTGTERGALADDLVVVPATLKSAETSRGIGGGLAIRALKVLGIDLEGSIVRLRRREGREPPEAGTRSLSMFRVKRRRTPADWHAAGRVEDPRPPPRHGVDHVCELQRVVGSQPADGLAVPALRRTRARLSARDTDQESDRERGRARGPRLPGCPTRMPSSISFPIPAAASSVSCLLAACASEGRRFRPPISLSSRRRPGAGSRGAQRTRRLLQQTKCRSRASSASPARLVAQRSQMAGSIVIFRCWSTSPGSCRDSRAIRYTTD